jgi:hypothetical protein
VAGDWIKMRGALLDHPKVVAMTRVLHENREFREWLTPGGSSEMNGRIVSIAASRAVTTALLLRAWSAAREHGKFDGDDLWLEHSWIEDLDQLAGAPGVGLAMEAVGWAQGHPTKKGVILPNFKEFNVPMTEAERAKSYRERKRETITKPSRTHRDENTRNVTTRVEESRDIKPPNPRFAEFWLAYPDRRKGAKPQCEEKWSKHRLDTVADKILADIEERKRSRDWTKDGGDFIPAPLTYLNQRRWEASPVASDPFAGAI